MNPWHAGAFGAALLCGLFLFQYAHRRQSFILVLAAGWLLLAPAMLVAGGAYDTPIVARGAVGAAHLLGISAGLLLLWSGDLYRQTRYLRLQHLKVFAPVAAWFLLAPLMFGAGAVLAPGFIVDALLLAGAASLYAAVLIERHMIGAGLVAFALLGLAISNVATALSLQHIALPGQTAFQLVLVNGVLSSLCVLGMHLLVFEDMTYELRTTNRRLEAAREELTQAAITDPLTGCHNRRFLDQVAGRELQRHERFRLPMSLLFIDVNRFKAVNDSLGHEAGDRVLQYVSRFLKAHIREADYVFRWGGDEFLALITCTGDEVRRKATMLKAAFDAAPATAELPPGIGLSVGWAEVPQGSTDLMPLVAEADRRMYQDKGTGGTRSPGLKRRGSSAAP